MKIEKIIKELNTIQTQATKEEMSAIKRNVKFKV
jgi:hypothetical protein